MVEHALRALKERVQEALFLRSVALRIDRSRIGRRLLAALLFTYGDLGRAGRQWSRIRHYVSDLDDDDISFQFGYLQLEFGMIDESIAVFRTLLDRAILLDDPVDPGLVSNLMDALNSAGRYGDAIAVFEDIVPSIALSGPADAIHYNAGISYYESGKFAESVRCYQTALRLRTSNTCHILHNLGNCHSELGDEEAALKHYRLALDAAVTDAERGMEEYAMGISSAELGRHEDARSYYLRAADHGHAKAKERLTELSPRIDS